MRFGKYSNCAGYWNNQQQIVSFMTASNMVEMETNKSNKQQMATGELEAPAVLDSPASSELTSWISESK